MTQGGNNSSSQPSQERTAECVLPICEALGCVKLDVLDPKAVCLLEVRDIAYVLLNMKLQLTPSLASMPINSSNWD